MQVYRALCDHDKLIQKVDEGEGKRLRGSGGGRKLVCPEIGTALFRYLHFLLLYELPICTIFS